MEKAYWVGREETMPNSYARIARRAVILCAVAVPVVGFNIFASSQHNDAILSWSLAVTVTFTMLGSAFVLWATNILWPQRRQSGGSCEMNGLLPAPKAEDIG